MSFEKLPVIKDDIISALDKVYPSLPPDLSDTDREIWFKAGQRSVVAFLIEQQKRQKESLLTNSVIQGV